ncbi:hypothetical protein [Propylenella binzhouense]|uniref:hypothetical protein n=1 Tax=Propylenella binzhouense TaxID=2555902 RepID=UPI00136DC711|nr:hypothetical protein [Propylenella binzhouense]
MAEPVVHTFEAGHPAPHADRVSLPALFYGLCAGPAAWGAQLLLIYGLASYACFPSEMLRDAPVPGFRGIVPVLAAINVVALAIAASGAVVSWRNWRLSQSEAKGAGRHLLEAGEGRTRFISVWGVLTGAGFFVAIAFDTIAVFGVPLCGS